MSAERATVRKCDPLEHMCAQLNHVQLRKTADKEDCHGESIESASPKDEEPVDQSINLTTSLDIISKLLRSPPLYSSDINYALYDSERQMPDIMALIQKDLSEPYSIYTYRYFIANWPDLCYLAFDNDKIIAAIICKLETCRERRRGYIAMLAVNQEYRRKKIGCNLVLRSIRQMQKHDAKEVVLETEITNKPALQLYENLGFIRAKRMFRYYLNGYDAFRLKLCLK